MLWRQEWRWMWPPRFKRRFASVGLGKERGRSFDLKTLSVPSPPRYFIFFLFCFCCFREERWRMIVCLWVRSGVERPEMVPYMAAPEMAPKHDGAGDGAKCGSAGDGAKRGGAGEGAIPGGAGDGTQCGGAGNDLSLLLLVQCCVLRSVYVRR